MSVDGSEASRIKDARPDGRDSGSRAGGPAGDLPPASDAAHGDAPGLRRWFRDSRVWRYVYIVLLHGVGSFAISGGLEFAIAYGMYRSSERPVTLWALPNTLSGDAAVTIFVQAVVTWVIEHAIVHGDVRGGTAPRLSRPHEPQHHMLRQYFALQSTPLDWTPAQPWSWWTRVRLGVVWLVNDAVRALILSVPLFLVFWPVTMGILAGIGSRRPGTAEYEYAHYPMPQLYKFVLGGSLGLVMTPMIATYHLLQHQWRRGAAPLADTKRQRRVHDLRSFPRDDTR